MYLHLVIKQISHIGVQNFELLLLKTINANENRTADLRSEYLLLFYF